MARDWDLERQNHLIICLDQLQFFQLLAMMDLKLLKLD